MMSPPEKIDAATLPDVKAGARVALLGGSFNPPHIAHALLAHAALAALDVDAVWVMPCADHPFAKSLAPFDMRLEMCRRAFRHLRACDVIDVEARLPVPSFTVQTVRALKAARPDVTLLFLVGADILAELPRWREPEVLRTLVRLVVFPRPGHMGGELAVTLPDVSSTAIRQALERGDDATGVLDRAVIEVIERRGLYRDA
jgi:nicotinate-nucleotide adenylyltransferase